MMYMQGKRTRVCEKVPVVETCLIKAIIFHVEAVKGYTSCMTEWECNEGHMAV